MKKFFSPLVSVTLSFVIVMAAAMFQNPATAQTDNKELVAKGQ
jgi:hypothetical protein